MLIKQIKANQFKSYAHLELDLSEYCNVIYGLNGSGKTNLLDAIHFACLGKSYFSITDKQAIQYEKEFFRIEAQFISDQNEKVQMAISVPNKGRKKIWWNKTILKKNTDILGLVPLVCVVPDDIDLIKGSSIVRRKFMDRILCQLSATYTQSLIHYERVLKQKLAVLKNTPSIQALDLDLLASYDEMLYSHGQVVYSERLNFCNSFETIFEEMYQEIAGTVESAKIEYESNFSTDSFFEDSRQNREIDYYTKRVRKGIHRDDVLFHINNQNVRKYASQGQKKTFIYALKFSEYLFLSDQSKRKPILLLDDIFEKLDEKRLKQLFSLVSSSRFGQIFITDTEKNRSGQILEELKVSYQTYHVKEFNISRTNG